MCLDAKTVEAAVGEGDFLLGSSSSSSSDSEVCEDEVDAAMNDDEALEALEIDARLALVRMDACTGGGVGLSRSARRLRAVGAREGEIGHLAFEVLVGTKG